MTQVVRIPIKNNFERPATALGSSVPATLTKESLRNETKLWGNGWMSILSCRVKAIRIALSKTEGVPMK